MIGIKEDRKVEYRKKLVAYLKAKGGARAKEVLKLLETQESKDRNGT